LRRFNLIAHELPRAGGNIHLLRLGTYAKIIACGCQQLKRLPLNSVEHVAPAEHAIARVEADELAIEVDGESGETMIGTKGARHLMVLQKELNIVQNLHGAGRIVKR